MGTDGFLAGAAFAALGRASAQPSAAALLTPKNPFCHCIILNLKWYYWRKLQPIQLLQCVIFGNGRGGLPMFCHPFSFNKIQCGFVFNPLIFLRQAG